MAWPMPNDDDCNVEDDGRGGHCDNNDDDPKYILHY